MRNYSLISVFSYLTLHRCLAVDTPGNFVHEFVLNVILSCGSRHTEVMSLCMVVIFSHCANIYFNYISNLQLSWTQFRNSSLIQYVTTPTRASKIPFHVILQFHVPYSKQLNFSFSLSLSVSFFQGCWWFD